MIEWVTISIPVPSVDLVTVLLVNWGIGVVMIGVYALAWMVKKSHAKGERIPADEFMKVFGFIAPFGMLLIASALLIRVLRLNK